MLAAALLALAALGSSPRAGVGAGEDDGQRGPLALTLSVWDGGRDASPPRSARPSPCAEVGAGEDDRKRDSVAPAVGIDEGLGFASPPRAARPSPRAEGAGDDDGKHGSLAPTLSVGDEGLRVAPAEHRDVPLAELLGVDDGERVAPQRPSAAAEPQSAPTAVVDALVPTVPQRLGATVAALGVSVVSLAAGIALGMLLPYAVFAASGRPSPFALTGGFLVGTGLGSLGAWYLAPQVVRLFGDGSVTTVRDGAFSVSRWAMAALGASVVTFGVGAGLEASAFGRGQGVMIGAIVAGLVATLAVLVCETVGVAVAWQPAR